MRCAAYLLGALVACHHETPVTPPSTPSADVICALAKGQCDAWHGMPKLALDGGPACLGAAIAQGIDKHFGFRHFTAYRVDGAEVRLLGIPAEASVVEVVPAQPLDARTTTSALPAPDARVRRSDDTHELVYAQRGMALLVAKSADGIERIVRLRGFEPMTAKLYEARYGPHQRLGFP